MQVLLHGSQLSMCITCITCTMQSCRLNLRQTFPLSMCVQAAAMLIHRQYDKHAWPLRSRGDVFTVLRLATGATWAYLASDWLLNHLPGTFTVVRQSVTMQNNAIYCISLHWSAK